MDVKRYDLVEQSKSEPEYLEMREAADGEWVRWEDIESMAGTAPPITDSAPPLSLWKLYCTDTITRQPRQAYVLAASMSDACALWPEWSGSGSGSCKAGPEAHGDAIKIPIIGIAEAPWPGAPLREDPREAIILDQAQQIGRLEVELAEARYWLANRSKEVV